VDVDLSALKASEGAAEIGHLPAASLPVIAAVLAAFFELDNTANAQGESKASEKSGEVKKVRVGGAEEEEESAEDEEEEAPPAKKRR
jgi:hypothetical protein